MMKIRIVAPAKQIEKKCIDFAVQFLNENGFDVSVGNFTLNKHYYFAGTDAERLQDMQEALNDEALDFILCARGGYGTVRIIDDLNFEKFKKHPKTIIGFSDITVFHSHIHQNYNIPTVHATVPLNFESNTKLSLNSLLNVLGGLTNKYEFDAHAMNINGEVEGVIVGGNLAILQSLLGSKSDLNTESKILFIEDIAEPIYAIDRMMYALKRAGKLEKLKGLIVGGLTGIRDTEIPYGMSSEELIHNIMKPYGVPICFNFPAGHIDDNRAIILGKKARLMIRTDKVEFIQ